MKEKEEKSEESGKSKKFFESIKNKIKRRKIVLSIGRFVYYKGFEYLIESARILKNKKIDNIAFIIIGYGELYNKLKQKIEDYKLSNNVFLLNNIKNVNIFLKNCDIFCLPSIERTEAFGLVLLEALYYGKPLITTNVYGSGMSYINKNGLTGFVVKARDAKEIAKAILKLANNKKLYKKFSLNASKRFNEFRIDSIGDKIIKLYKGLMR